MSIERSEGIRFHEQGTLDAVTRWIAYHHDGIAEWCKNVRRQYQADRANVAIDHRVAVLLLKDAKEGKPARIGILDVGGATLEDVTAWSTWQDPEASHRGSQIEEEETQGNGICLPPDCRLASSFLSAGTSPGLETRVPAWSNLL